MHSSAIESTRDHLRVRNVESFKYVGLACMLYEHCFRYVFDSLPWSAWLIGRMAFPLFAVSLAVATVNADRDKQASIVGRMVLWMVIATAFASLYRPLLPLNVLGTLALGMLAHMSWHSELRGPFDRALMSALYIACGYFFEFGPVGVVTVFFFFDFARAIDKRHSLISFACAVIALCIANIPSSASAAASLFFVVLLYMLHGCDFQPRRIKRLFYWSYCLQFPIFWGLGWMLAR